VSLVYTIYIYTGGIFSFDLSTCITDESDGVFNDCPISTSCCSVSFVDGTFDGTTGFDCRGGSVSFLEDVEPSEAELSLLRSTNFILSTGFDSEFVVEVNVCCLYRVLTWDDN
jgi:hypothetical protein